MKKVIVSMMLAVALFGGTAFAQNQAQGNTGATQQQTEQTQKGKKEGKKKMNRPAFNPFDGVQLTQDQQQRLQVLRQGLGPVVLDKEQQAKIKENPNLTPEQKKQLKEERKANKLQAKKNYLNGVKEILTPDQYVIFLENCYIYTPQQSDKATKMGKAKKSNKGQKGSKDRKDKKDNSKKRNK